MKMSKSMHIVCAIALLLIVYTFVQTLATVIDMILVRGDMSVWHIDWVLFLSSIITSIAILSLSWWRGDLWNIVSINWKWAPLMFVITILGMMATDIMNELMSVGNLGIMEEMFGSLSSSIIGIIAIAVLGPVCEELLFRAGIEGVMLKRGVNPWVAIIVSAVIFGAIHLNPGQLLPATLGGVMFGILYWKTRSVIPGIICHVVNNSLAVVVMRSDDMDKNQTFTSLLGSWWVVLIALLLLLTLVAWVFYIYIKQRPSSVVAVPEVTETEIQANQPTDSLS